MGKNNVQKEVMLTEKGLRWKPRSDSSPEQSEENFSGQKSSFQSRACPGSGQRPEAGLTKYNGDTEVRKTVSHIIQNNRCCFDCLSIDIGMFPFHHLTVEEQACLQTVITCSASCSPLLK